MIKFWKVTLESTPRTFDAIVSAEDEDKAIEKVNEGEWDRLPGKPDDSPSQLTILEIEEIAEDDIDRLQKGMKDNEQAAGSAQSECDRSLADLSTPDEDEDEDFTAGHEEWFDDGYDAAVDDFSTLIALAISDARSHSSIKASVKDALSRNLPRLLQLVGAPLA